jgi:hypothetical protein
MVLLEGFSKFKNLSVIGSRSRALPACNITPQPATLTFAPSQRTEKVKYITRVRFEVFTAVTMKNDVLWDIKIQFVPQRKHITSPLQSPASYYYVRFEFFTAVTVKNVVF